MEWIEEQFPTFLATIDNLPDKESYPAFSNLINMFAKSGLLEKNLTIILESINKLPDRDKFSAYGELEKEFVRRAFSCVLGQHRYMVYNTTQVRHF